MLTIILIVASLLFFVAGLATYSASITQERREREEGREP